MPASGGRQTLTTMLCGIPWTSKCFARQTWSQGQFRSFPSQSGRQTCPPFIARKGREKEDVYISKYITKKYTPTTTSRAGNDKHEHFCGDAQSTVCPATQIHTHTHTRPRKKKHPVTPLNHDLYPVHFQPHSGSSRSARTFSVDRPSTIHLSLKSHRSSSPQGRQTR